MEIRDIVHGSILVESHELSLIDSRYFQRLRQIRQLGFAEYSFPSATHNRYIHSLGAMQVATLAFDVIFGTHRSTTFSPLQLPIETLIRLRSILRIGALLHDLGHGPLSHTTEFAMPDFQKLHLTNPLLKEKLGKASHEDYTLKMILDSGLSRLIEKAGRSHGFTPIHVASLIEPKLEIYDNFFIEKINGEKIDFRPILTQLISSELDVDRLDYLRRDSIQAGVSYGQFDFNWLVRNLTFHIHNEKCYLSLQHRALYAFEDFLISRFHMFLMVYFHYKSVVYDEMLKQYFESPDCDYHVPADIEKYCEYNDNHLYSHLVKSNNPWAKRITEKHPYRMLVELHSGIPATKTAHYEQELLLARIQEDLAARKIYYLLKTSTSELSKYFQKPGEPIFVHYDNQYSTPSWIPLEQCMDLFQRYSEKRSITRIYLSPEDFALCRSRGRDLPLPYEPEYRNT